MNGMVEQVKIVDEYGWIGRDCSESICLSIYILFTYLYTYLPIYLYIYLSIYRIWMDWLRLFEDR